MIVAITKQGNLLLENAYFYGGRVFLVTITRCPRMAGGVTCPILAN